jgi:hypothetical protein
MTQEPGTESHEDVATYVVRADVVADMERVRTGDDRVDSVIAAIEGLEGRPVEEHVAAFEQAHDELRRALDGSPPDEPA